MARGPRPGAAGGPDAAAALAMRGAVDLGALAQAREAQAAAAQRAEQRVAAGGDESPAALVINVDEASFQAEVVERSYQVPVVIDFWADWCGPCKQLSPILESLATEDAGTWVLAKVDVDANPRLGQAFQVQSIPSLFAVVAGQPIPLFQGALPEPQVRQFIDELLRVAAENGVSGRVAVDGAGVGEDPAADAEPADVETADLEPPIDPDLDAAADAIAAGDLDAAAAAYSRLLDRIPGDPDGTAGLALVGLMQRVAGLDADVTVAAGTAPDASADQRRAAADVLLLSGRSADAFAVLVDGVRVTAAEDRDALRAHLLALFEVAGPDDPSVVPARLALANALF